MKHYRGLPNGNANNAVWFQVRYFKSGQLFVRVWVDNGRLDLAASARSYLPSVVIGGVQIFNHGGVSLTHYAHTRWSQEAWIGAASPVDADIDTDYLVGSRLLPNYTMDIPAQAALDGLIQIYVPLKHAAGRRKWGKPVSKVRSDCFHCWTRCMSLHTPTHAHEER